MCRLLLRSGVGVWGVAKAPGILTVTHLLVSLLPRLDVVSSKRISLCGFPINTSQGELVNMDEAF